MRPFAVLLAIASLAATAGAEPFVRWIDEGGEIQRREIADVLDESISRILVRFADGKEAALPTIPILDYVRENENEVEQAQLLEARVAAEQGRDLEQCRSVLDRLAVHGTKPWIREYAAAGRAIAAANGDEPDALDRIAKFLEASPKSRLVPQVLLAKARLESRRGNGADRPFTLTFEKIGELKGPRMLQYRAFLDGLEVAVSKEEVPLNTHLSNVEAALPTLVGDAQDVATSLIAESTRVWAILHIESAERKARVREGHKPAAALVWMRKVRDQSAFLIPDVISDANLELGRTAAACGLMDEARAALEKARDVAPDDARRAAALNELKKLEKTG